MIGLVVLMILGGVAVVAAFILNPPKAAPPPTVSYDVPTAREAYPAALNLIRAQDVGALLMSAAGTWTPNINMAQLQAGRTGWTFYFYLPAKQQVASVIADTKSGARIASVQAWQTPPKVLDERSWTADSSSGMPAFLQKCQGDLSGQRRAIARMSTAAENGSLLWQFQVVTPDEQVVCEVAVDARTGQPRQ
jgi:hypothetical protein